MDRNFDYGGFPPYQPFGMEDDRGQFDPMLNPILQYEQGASYYRYLCLQMDYKIKCKEYERLCGMSSSQERGTSRKID